MKYLISILAALQVYGQDFVQNYPSAAGGNNLSTDLEVYLKFDETSGNALDASGNSRDFTEYGTLTTNLGKIVTARTHNSNANDDYFARTNEAWNTLGTNDFTITFWCKLDSTFVSSDPTGDAQLVGKGDFNDDLSWGLGLDRGSYPNDYRLGLWTSTNGLASEWQEIVGVDLSESPGFSQWFFILLKREAHVFYLSITPESETTILAPTASASYVSPFYDNSSVPLTIGSMLSLGAVNSSQDTSGEIDEFAVWSRALSDCEIYKLFNAGAGRSQTTFDGNPCL